jgi:hypothetical protein
MELRAHLRAALSRVGEGDSAVQAAYTRLREAAETYDDLLFELTGEVTPWEFLERDGHSPEFEDRSAMPDAVSVLVRRDYGLADSEALLDGGRDAYSELYPDEPREAAVADVSHPGRAIYQLLHAFGVDGMDRRAEGAGLLPRGGTVWVQALLPDDDGLDADYPFAVADEDMLVYRLDEIVED